VDLGRRRETGGGGLVERAEVRAGEEAVGVGEGGEGEELRVEAARFLTRWFAAGQLGAQGAALFDFELFQQDYVNFSAWHGLAAESGIGSEEVPNMAVQRVENGIEMCGLRVHPALRRHAGESHVERGKRHLDDATGDEEIDSANGGELMKGVVFVTSRGSH
jgi:hypothetical protein